MTNNKATSLGRIQQIHFVGIGGAGMSGIAEVLLNEGYRISGSDAQESPTTERLRALGAQVFIGHAAKNIEHADVVVKSTSIVADNPEIVAANEKHIPVIPRAQMLGELMRFRSGIAIAGTHGKTTTTSLMTSVLTEAGLDPTFVIGGLLNSAGANAKLGQGKHIVVEADESDASFLYLHPMITVVTNIDADHMETYGGNFETLRQTFLKFIQNIPFYGLAVVCLDDPVLKRSLPDIARPMLTYGFDPAADIAILPESYVVNGWQSTFEVKRRGRSNLTVTLKLPGKHNVLNAAAVIAVASEIGVPDQDIQKALAHFAGVGRRLQQHGAIPLSSGGSATLLDDYGHHPRELFVTLEALRAAYPERRIITVFQPHRYTRTRDLMDDFATVLSDCDVLCLLEVYAANEQPIPGADSRSLARAIRTRGKVEPILVDNHSKLTEILANIAQDGDIILLQGAGNIGKLAKDLATQQKL